ncbi:threonine-phosphate decarboxylase CobD [Primorskyibacter sp. S187A]|uniref:threonine-phosphate decarboxylase CobD n=1 Tax=Primorskyibacter sp. S187A TaxID=3415130 RepID=UPI003C7CCEBE
MNMHATPRDHGGNLDAAIAHYGGDPAQWLDLSTGINPVSYPVPPLPQEAWTALPRRSDMARLAEAAARAYGTQADVVPFAGAQGAIQSIPFILHPGRAAVLAPTYNEHAAALRMAGWPVAEVDSLSALQGADLAILVNPNNPDGNRYDPGELRDLADHVGLLIVDESFADPDPDLSLAPCLHDAPSIIVLRSFGKFFGLAGLRLGFALATGRRATRLAEFAGPWPISGPAIEIACAALEDAPWQARTCARLAHDSAALDGIAQEAGWTLIGGTPLFRTYATPDATATQDRLAQAMIWSRIFPYSETWIRLGLPPDAAGMARIRAALGLPPC